MASRSPQPDPPANYRAWPSHGVTSAQIAAIRRERLARDDIHPVSSDLGDLGDLGVVISLDWQFR